MELINIFKKKNEFVRILSVPKAVEALQLIPSARTAEACSEGIREGFGFLRVGTVVAAVANNNEDAWL